MNLLTNTYVLASQVSHAPGLGSRILFLAVDSPVIAYMGSLQIAKRQLRRRLWRPLALAAVGVVYYALYAAEYPISHTDLLLIGLSFAVLSVGLGVVRAYTVRIWVEGGVPFRQGTKITLALWAAAVGIHLSLDIFTGAVAASLPLYLAVTWIIQILVVRHRRQSQVRREQADFAAAQQLWSRPAVLGTVGMFIFATYLTMPELMEVPVGGPGRSAATIDAERTFLARLVGLAEEPEWRGGIANPRVWDMVLATARRHRQYAGLAQSQLDFMAAVLALAPLRVSESMALPVDDEAKAAYWRYIERALSPFSTLPSSEAEANALCMRAIESGAGSSPRGSQLLEQLHAAHPDYLRQAVPALFPRTATVLTELMAGERNGLRN